MDIIERAREGRKSPATLKLKLSQLRSRFNDHPVLILEGVDDIGPYETWINRVSDSTLFKFLPGEGKEQLLGLRTLLTRDETGLRSRVFFAVDRDFDDLIGHDPGSDVFCTDRYSVESYLFADKVVASVFRDEFRLAEHSEDFDLVMGLYRDLVRTLIEAITPLNFYIYSCRRLGVRFKNPIPKVNTFVFIHVDRIHSIITSELLESELPTIIPIPSERLDNLRDDFQQLEPVSRYRGKFYIQFLYKWLETLAEEARKPSGVVFNNSLSIKFSTASMTLRSLAARSDMPSGFSDFVLGMQSSTQ